MSTKDRFGDDTLAELAAILRVRKHSRHKTRRVSALICLALGLGLLIVPKPETPPLWLTLLFISAILIFTLCLGWLCQGLNEDVGRGSSANAPEFTELLAHLPLGDATEVIPIVLDIWSELSHSQHNVLVPFLPPLLARLDASSATTLTRSQRCALEEIVQRYPHTDAAILGLLTLASAQHYGNKLLPLAHTWTRQADRRGAAAREYLMSLEGRRS